VLQFLLDRPPIVQLLKCFPKLYGKGLFLPLGVVSIGMLRHVALVTTDVSEELSASFIRVIGIDETRNNARCN
jgi:hypothetical protein